MESIIKTKKGAVEGLVSESGATVLFKGIPYAKPPVGELRFALPQEVESWAGIKSCKAYGPKCPQADSRGMDFYGKEFYNDDTLPMDEDCLTLNIWTPAHATPQSKLPVLLWIHGGAFLHGWGGEKEFDGEGFAEKGVILVTINYRVNVFGFFTHPALEQENPQGVSGNYGIWDQLMAIRWVRENIADFGGDGEKITLCGQSAGCMSVQTLISSPLTQGLVRSAILQSGGGIRALHTTPSRDQLTRHSQALMDHVGVTSISALRALPWAVLRDAAYALAGEGLRWAPHVDGCLLSGTVDDLAEKGEILRIPTLIGSTGDDIGGGTLLQESAARWCENQLKLGSPPSYLYYFNRKLPGDQAGAFHSSELWYVFETLSRCWRPFTPQDHALAHQMASYWAEFVRTGDPNGDSLPLWSPYTKGCKVPMVLE